LPSHSHLYGASSLNLKVNTGYKLISIERELVNNNNNRIATVSKSSPVHPECEFSKPTTKVNDIIDVTKIHILIKVTITGHFHELTVNTISVQHLHMLNMLANNSLL